MRSSHSRFNRFMSGVGLLGLMILSTCSVNQVGLGAKVDITPPKVAITGPAEDGQYLRGDVVLSGTASDDLGIASLTITYPSAAGPDVISPLAVSGGLWSITIPTGTPEGLPEGQVTLTASVIDSSGKTTSDTLLAYIDNKAPTILVTSPISYAALAKDAPQYTDSLDIKGEVYDPSPIPAGSVKVRLLNMSDRTPVPTTGDAQGWQVAEGTNTFAVRFLLKNSLFSDADDKKGYYYEVSATDQAGNVSSYYYHRNDIYDVLPANTIFPSMNELGRIDQARTGESDISHIPYSGLATIQLGTTTPTTPMGNFQYSAVSKPKIKFSNFDQDKPQSENALAPNSVITGSISPDANGGAIVPSSVTVEFLSGNVTGATIVTLQDTDNSSLSDNIELLGFGDSIVFTVNLKNGATQLPPGLYGIRVTATAKGSQPQSAEGDFIIDDNAPILTETKINTGALTPKNAAFTLGGRAKAGTALKTIEVFQAQDPTPVSDTPALLVQTIQLNGSVDTDWETAALPIPLGDGTYYYMVKLSSISGKSSTVFRTILFDASAPTLAVASPAAASWTASQTIAIKGTADDANGTGVNAVRVWVGAKTATPPADVSTWPLATGTVSWSYNVADLGVEGEKKLWVTSQDKAGNWNTAPTTVLFGYDSALPDTTVTTGLYQTAATTFQLEGTASDNLGVASVTATGNGITAGTLTLNGGTTSRTWSVDVSPSADGAYTYSVLVTDVAGQTKTVTHQVRFDRTPPELSVANLADGDALSNAAFSIKGTVSDDNGVASLEYSLNQGTTWTTQSNPNTSWSIPVNGLIEGSTQKIRLRATDKAGKQSFLPAGGTTDISFGLDLANPTLTSNAAALNGTNKKSAFSLSGTAQDNNGVKLLEYSFDGGTTWTTIAGTSSNNAVVNWTQNIAVPADGSADGLKALRIRATDNFDKTTMDSASVRIDASAPTLSLTNLTDAQLITTLSFTATGSVTDNGGSGIDKVEYSFDGTTWTSAAITGASWSAPLTLTQKQGQRLIFRAKDVAGNVTTPVAGTSDLSVNVDTAVPTLSESTVGTSNQVYRTAGFSFSGNAADSNSLSSIKISATQDGVAKITNQSVAFDADGPDNILHNADDGPWTYAHPVNTGTNADDGLWIFTITATDIVGRTVTSSRTVLIDSKVPTVTIDALADPFYEATLPASGAANDSNGGAAVSGLQKVEYSIDGTNWFTATGTDSWSKTVNIAAASLGAKTLSVKATDRAGNVSTTATRGFKIDRAAPGISETSYTGTSYKKANFAFSVDLSDDLALPASGLGIVLKVDGVTKTAPTLTKNSDTTTAQNYTFTVPVSHGDGIYQIALTATDGAGRTTTLTRTVNVDTLAPVLTISNLVDGDLIVASNLTVLGTATDGAGSGIKKIQYSLDGGAFTDTTGTVNWAAALTGLTNGLAHSIVFQAEDNSGNLSTAGTLTARTRAFKVDLALPALAETTSGIANANLVFKNAAVTLAGTVTDANTVTHLTVAYQKDGGTLTTPVDDTDNNGTWTYTLPFDGAGHTADGLYELTITATDGAGRVTTLARKIQIDTKSPDLTITAPIASELVDVTGYTIRGQVNDNGGKGITTLEYSKNSTNGTDGTWTNITLSGLNWSVASVNFSTGGQGGKTLWVRADDGLNPVTKTSQNFNYDTDVPTLSEATVGTTNQVIRAAGFNFAGLTADTNSLSSLKISATQDGVAKITNQTIAFDADGADNTLHTADDGPWTYTHPVNAATHADDGLWIFTLTATDVAGRTVSTSRTVLIDTKLPTVSLDALTDPFYDATVSASGDADDANGGTTVSGLLKVEYSTDGSTWFTATGTDSWAKTFSATALTVGTKTLSARSTDRAGNVSSIATTSFTIDRAVPGISETTYSGTVYRKANFAFTVNLSDDLGLASSGLAVVLKVDGVTKTTPVVTKNTDTGIAQNYTFTVPVSHGSGLYEVGLTATDSTGRTAVLTRSILVDLAAPTVAITYPAANDIVSTSSLTVAGTASDGAGSGLQQVEYSLDGSTWFLLNGTSNWNKAIALGGEGAKTLSVRATDNVAQVTSPIATVAFNLDQTPPSLTETDLGAASPKRNGTFTISGTSADTNGLKTWDDPIDGMNAVMVPYVEINDGSTSQKVTVAANAWTYSYPVASNGSQDGNVTFTITAEDVVGKQTTLTRIVTIDTTKPVITIDGVIAGLNVSTSQVNGTMTFRFSADDAGVGLEKDGNGKYLAYYTIVAHSVMAPASTAADIASWTAIAPSSSSVFTFNANTKLLTDGNYDLWLGVRDAVPGTPNARAFKFSPAAPSNPQPTDISLAVAQASDRPLISFDNLNVAATQNSDNGLGKNPTILLTLQDDDKIKVSDLQYRIDINNDGLYNLTKDFWDGNAVVGADNSIPDGSTDDKWEDETVWYNFEETPASDGSLVQAKIKLTGFPQGVFGLQVRVRDNTDGSAWAAIYDQGTNFSWQKSGTLPFSVDFGPPTIKVTTPLAGTYRTNLTLAGTTKDLLGVVRVRYTFDGVTETTVYNNPNPTVAISSSALVAGLPYVITGLGSGTDWNFVGAGPGAVVGTTFIASGSTGGTGLAKIDPSVEIPFTGTIDTSALPTGEYTLQVIATDIGGSDATQQIPITIDKDLPTVTFLQPGASNTLNGPSVKISGEASDNRKVGAVFLWHGLVTDPNPALPAQTAAPSIGNPNGLYSAGGYTQLAGTGIWNTNIDTTGQVLTAANAYRIRVVSVDAIGNVGVPVDLPVTIDQETDRPVVGFSNLNLLTPSRLPAGNVTIIGTVSDDDSVDASTIQIRLDRNGNGDYNDANEGWRDISDAPLSNSVVVSWSHEITDMTSQGSRHVQVRVRDVNGANYTTGYGWSESPSVAFYIDNGPPTLDLTAPTIGQRFNAGQFTLTGSTNDTNGIHRIVVWVDDNDDQVKDSGELTTIQGPSVAATTIVQGQTYTIEALNGTDFTSVAGPTLNTLGSTFTALIGGGSLTGTGTVRASLTTDENPYVINSVINSFSNAAKSVKAVQVTSYDVSMASTTRDLSIVYDPTLPTASFNTPNEGATVNGTISVSGLGGDNYQLDNIYYNVSPLASPAPAFPAAYTSLAQSYSWNFNLDTTALTDGAYVIRIVARDKALNNSSAAPTVRNIIVDQTSDRPVFAVLTLNEAGTAVDNLLPASLQISGTVSDDDAVDKSRIQIRTRTLPAGTFSAWGAISGAPLTNVSLATWSHTFTGFTDGQYEFELRAGDVHDLGNWATFSSGSSSTVKFAVDLNLPTGAIAAPAQGSAKRDDFTINGTAADASGIKKVSIAYDNGGGYGAETLLVNDTNAADGYLASTPWTTNYDVTGSNDGQTFYRVTITDAFDKVRTYEQYFTVDTTAPANAFQLPSAGATVNGSVELRGSSTDTGAITKIYAKVLNGTDPGNWAPGTTPAAEGWTLITGTYNWTYRFKSTSFTDGAATIFVMSEDAAGNRSNPTLAANQLAVTVSQATNLPVITLSTSNNALLDNSGTVTGTITDDDGVDTSTLQISFDNGSTWRAVSSPGSNGLTVNFSHALSAGAGLVQSATPYQVVLRVSDVGENFDGGDFSGAQDIAPVTRTSTAIAIKKDDADPVAVVSTIDNGLGPIANLQGAYLNNKLTLAGTATDGVGVSTVEARLVGVAAFATVTNTGTNFSTWTWNQTGLSLSGSSVSLEVKVTDVNGRSTTQSYTLLVDTTLPTVGFDSTTLNPDTATGTYNGNVTFRGNAADNVQVSKVYYQFASSDPGVPNATFTGWTLAAATYSWTASLNTTAVNNTAVDSAYKLWAVSVDGAGNPSARQSLSFTINQASDRPVVVITAPTASQVFDVNAKAQGTAADDDGLASIEVRIDRDNNGVFGNIANETYVPVSLPVTVSGKSLNLEHVLSTLADAPYKLQFRVRDSLFVSTGATPFNEYETGVIDYSIDTAPPSLSLTKITVQDRYPADGVSVPAITSNFNGSYVNNDLTFEFNASDASGISSVQVSTDGTVWSNATHGAGAVYTYALTVPLNQTFDGTKNIQYRTTDSNGKVTSAIVTLIVDTAEPVVAFTSPAGISALISDEAPNANGSVTVFGTVTDSSSITSVAIAVGKGTPHVLTNIGNNLSWKVTFPASTYQNSTDATETSGGSNVWRLPVTVTTYEFAGNSRVSIGYVDLDPNGDKPIVAIASPAANASTTGIITLTGSVSDDDGTSGTVDIDVDANNNGSYADGADQHFANVTVANGAWSQQINTGATLSGTIRFRVTPKDSGGIVGDTLDRVIFIDNSLPLIVGYNGSAETAVPTPLTGTKQKGTITVRALFKDDDVIPAGNIQVSLDGGTTYVATSTQPGYSLNQLADAGGKKRYDVQFQLNTATYFTNNSGNGSLSVILQITDNTYKPAVVSLSYAADNRPPEVYWTSSLVPQSGVYSLYGNVGNDNNKLIGTAWDGGSVSGVASVNVYFVKNGNFRNPKLLAGSTSVTNAVIADGLYSQLAFTAAAINTGTGIMTLDRTSGNPAALGGTVNNALPVRFIGASLPGGLDSSTLYYVRDVSGNTFKLSLSPTDATRISFSSTGSGTMAMEYSLYGIPYTSDVYAAGGAGTHYAIEIDKRTELGSNDGNANGDNDGFQESLKDGGGFDDWFSYFDTTKLPDGPLDIYQVTIDNSGNKVVGKVSGQITNNPPSIANFANWGGANWASPGAGQPLQQKVSGTVDLEIKGQDTNTNPGLTDTGWRVDVTERWSTMTNGVPSGALALTPFFYNTSGTGGAVRAFTSVPANQAVSGSGRLSINTASDGFIEGSWYKVVATVTDIDGNTATNFFYVKINNSDLTAPVVTFPELTQTSVSDWTVKTTPMSLDIPASSLTNASANIAATLPSWMTVNSKVKFANGAAPLGFTPGAIYYLKTIGNPFTLSATLGGSAVAVTTVTTGAAFTLVSGGHVEAKADSGYDNAAPDADVSGSVKLTGTAYDDTDIKAIGLQINGVGSSATVASNLVTYNAHGLSNGTPIYFTATTMPSNLTAGMIYYVVNSATNTFGVSATVNGGAITTTGGTAVKFWVAATSTQQAGGSAVLGYTYDWTYEWDTSRIATTAKKNVTVTVNAIDLATTPNSTTVSVGTAGTVDVLPHITSITDSTGLSTDVLRGSTGAYSISVTPIPATSMVNGTVYTVNTLSTGGGTATNFATFGGANTIGNVFTANGAGTNTGTVLPNSATLNVRGYNLGRSGNVPSAVVSTAYTGWASPLMTGRAPVLNSVNEILVYKGLAKSGYLTIVVNSEPSGNNLNSNSNANNIESAVDPRTAQWTDDRYLWVWGTSQVGLTTLTSTTSDVNNLTYYNPTMVMNSDQPDWAFNDDNNGLTIYTTSDTDSVRRTGFRKMYQAALQEVTIPGGTYAGVQRFIASTFDSELSTGDSTGYLEVSALANQAADGFNTQYNPSVVTNNGQTARYSIQWPAIQGVDYYAANDETTETYRTRNRFPHTRFLAEVSTIGGTDYGSKHYLTYYDASPYHKSLNFVSYRYTANAAPTSGSANFIVASAGFIRSPDVMTIPGTSGGNSSEFYDMAKVGTTGIAVAYYDANSRSLKLATNTAAYQTTGTAATENLTNTGREENLITITSATKTQYAPATNGGTSLKAFKIYSGATEYNVFYDNSGSQNMVPPTGYTTGTLIRVNLNTATASVNGIITATMAAIRTAAPTVFEVQRLVSTSLTNGLNYTGFYVIPFAQGNVTDMTSNLATATAVGSTAKVRDGGTSTWSTMTVDNSADVGQYVSMVSDGSGKIYLAYYDFDNADLKFARLSWNGNTGTPTLDGIARVDTYLSAGTWTNLMLLNNQNLTGQNSLQPMIAYYSDSYNGTKKPVRLAFPKFDATSGSISNGSAGDDTYSGAWEVMTVPAVTSPQGGAATFNKVQVGKYSSTLPVLGWLGSKLEYGKLMANN